MFSRTVDSPLPAGSAPWRGARLGLLRGRPGARPQGQPPAAGAVLAGPPHDARVTSVRH